MNARIAQVNAFCADMSVMTSDAAWQPEATMAATAPPPPPAGVVPPPVDAREPLVDAAPVQRWRSGGQLGFGGRTRDGEPERRAFPRPPTTALDLGVPVGLVEDIFMRRLMGLKVSSTSAMSADLAISLSVVQQIADGLRDKKLLEYLGLDGRDYRFTLTEAGHQATTERMNISLYAGHVPVSLQDYERVVEVHRDRPRPNRADTTAAMSDLVMPTRLIDKLGAAMLNDGAIFIYGPPGTGKTSLAERVGNVSADAVLIPHCIEVDGNIVMVFDPSIHRPVEQPEGLDPRWVACERPFVIVGGELNMGMLDLSHDPVTGVYSAPKQLLANNGILVIDDFGRQLVSPDEILNRWIVPLSRNVDFLKLGNGTTFTTPFAVKLIVSSNMDPNDLGDEAFLRRLRNKVYVGACSDEDFDEILTLAADRSQVSLTPQSAEHLRKVARHYVGDLRPYIAVDFCDLMQGICEYEERAPVMDAPMIADIAELYFVTSN